MPANPSLSIVVPCYNEEKNIPLIVNRFQEALSRYKGQAKIEIILVNNGSMDNSAQVMEQEILKNGSGIFRVETVQVNQGYGFGILSGLRSATGAVLSWTHADMQTDPYDVFRAFEIFQAAPTNNLVIKGNRVGRKAGEWAFTLGMSCISSVLLGKVLFDINAQPKMFHRDFFNKFKNPPLDFSLDLYLLYMAKMNKTPIKTVDVAFTKRLHGVSNWAFSWKSKYKTILRTIRYIVALRDQLKLQQGKTA